MAPEPKTKRSGRFGRCVKTIAIAVALLYAGIVGVVGVSYRALVFPRPRRGIEPSLRGAELVRIEEPGASTVFAFYSPAPEGAPTLVCFHGNGEELADEVSLVAALKAEGVGVLAVEYPGYGLAGDQSTSETSIYSAAERAIAFLDRRDVSASSIVLVGFSLGSGVAVEMAHRGHGSKLVLLAPYTSMVDMVARYVPFVPTSLIVRDRFDTLAKAPAIHLPTFVVHGDSDPLIPVAMGKKVAAAFPDATLEVALGAHHNDLLVRDPTLVARIASFARSN